MMRSKEINLRSKTFMNRTNQTFILHPQDELHLLLDNFSVETKHVEGNFSCKRNNI